MIRRPLFSALLLCFLPAFSPACSAADYRITEAELTALQSDLNRLSKNNLQLTEDLKTSSADLRAARQRLAEYQQELARLQEQLLALKAETSQIRSDLQTANKLLSETKESLKQYESAVQSAIRSLKIQRLALGIAAVYFAATGHR